MDVVLQVNGLADTPIIHHEFYQWVRDNSSIYDIYISEYKENVPEGFEIVWEMESRKSIRNAKNEAVRTIEVLIKYKG